ncbi:hypothetical protein M8J76_005325 [Diaphorina citri]|nr:hypothetical protein M8J76_005325 [Diaphorina citri]
MLLEIRKMSQNKIYPITDELWLEQINKTSLPNNNQSYIKQLKLNKNNIKLNKIISELNDVFKTHSLYMNVVPGKDLEIYRSEPDGKFNMKLQGDNSTRYPYYVVRSPNPPHSGESRTFGFARRRLLFAIIPIMFKMGVMMTMLVVLMFLTLKSVAIGSLLLFIATVSVLSRIKYWLSPSSPPVVTPVTTFSSSPVNAFVSPVNAFASPVNAFASPLRNAVLQSEAGDGNGSNIHVHIHMNESQGMHWGTSSHIPDPASSYPPMVPMPDHTYAQNPYPYPPARDTYLHPPSGASMWSRQGVDGPLSITGIFNGQRIRIPLPIGRRSELTNPSAYAAASSSEDYAYRDQTTQR